MTLVSSFFVEDAINRQIGIGIGQKADATRLQSGNLRGSSMLPEVSTRNTRFRGGRATTSALRPCRPS